MARIAAAACLFIGLLAVASEARMLKDCGGATKGAALMSMPSAPMMGAMPMAAAPMAAAVTKKPAPTAPSLASALTAAPAGQFSTLLAAIKAAGLADALSNSTLAFTVFAPTNEAFDALIKALKTTPTALLANKALLTKVLSYHVVPAVAYSKDLKATQKVPTLLKDEGLTITVAKASPAGKTKSSPAAVVTVTGATNSAKVIAADVPVGPSVVHVIDTVLVPK